MGKGEVRMRNYKVEYIELNGWDETSVSGLWLAENDEWLLLHHIPVDYIIDGYVLIAKQHIRSRRAKKKHKEFELVLQLKGVKPEVPLGFSFSNTIGLLRWVESTYGLIHFMEVAEEESAFLGWLNEADVVHFWIDTLEPNGTVAAREQEEMPFVISEVCLISFADDYSESLKLLWQHKSRQKLLKPSNN